MSDKYVKYEATAPVFDTVAKSHDDDRATLFQATKAVKRNAMNLVRRLSRAQQERLAKLEENYNLAQCELREKQEQLNHEVVEAFANKI